MSIRARAVRVAALLTVTILTLAAAACGAEDPGGAAEAEETALPDGLTAYLDQSRVQRQGRTVFVRLVNDADRRVTVTRAEVSSDRFADVVWTGEKSFQNEADLEFELPPGECGAGSDARVRLTYRIDDGSPQVSTTTATDRYGAVALFLARDCAAAAFQNAAAVEVGEPRVVGRARKAVFELPVTFTPTGADGADGEAGRLAFAGFEDTVLFRNVAGSAAVGSVEPWPLRPGAGRREVLLRLVPTRCDPHALAEDKVGTLVGVRVAGADLPPDASFYLPLEDEARTALRQFFAVHCGI